MAAARDADRDGERLTFLGRPVGPAHVVRHVVVDPGAERRYVEAEWADALVVVERGELEVEALCGDRRSFASGAVLWLVGLPVRLLRNRGAEPVLILAVSRARLTPTPSAPADPATPAAGRTGTS